MSMREISKKYIEKKKAVDKIKSHVIDCKKYGYVDTYENCFCCKEVSSCQQYLMMNLTV